MMRKVACDPDLPPELMNFCASSEPCRDDRVDHIIDHHRTIKTDWVMARLGCRVVATRMRVPADDQAPVTADGGLD
jgi:hypothetical protein